MASKLKTLVDRIRQQRALDGPAEKLAGALNALYERIGGQRTADLLHGVWLGHPLHPVLIVVPLGGWTTAVTLDLVETLTGNTRLRSGADAALAAGLVGALPTALTGATDWRHTTGEDRRLGLVHASLNNIALLLLGAGLAARLGGRRGAGRLLTLSGYSVAMASGYLGGELAYDRQIGVNHAANEQPGDRWTAVLAEGELTANRPRRVEVDGVAVVLVRQGGQVRALAATCSHLGGPLDEGKLEDDGIVCPWHGSCFALDSGEVRRGPAVYPQPHFGVRVRDGQIELGPAGQEGQAFPPTRNGHREPAATARS